MSSLKSNKTLDDILPVCMRCGNVGMSDGSEGINFCHMCGSEGTCTGMNRSLYALFMTNFIQNQDPSRKYVDPFDLTPLNIERTPAPHDLEWVHPVTGMFNKFTNAIVETIGHL